MAKKIIDQPINKTLEALETTFKSSFRINPWEKSQLKSIFGDEQTTEQYMGLLLAEVSDEGVRNNLKHQIVNSMSQYGEASMFSNMSRAEEDFQALMHGPKSAMGFGAEMFSTEGLLAASQPGNNAGIYDPLMPAVILGARARAYQLEVFTPLNHNEYEWTFAFTISHVAKENAQGEKELYTNPNAFRDGSIQGLNNTEFVKCYYIDNSGTAAAYIVPQSTGATPVAVVGIYKVSDGTAIQAIDTAVPAAGIPVGAGDGEVVSIVKAGTRGNVIKMDGKRQQDWALAEDMRISYLLYDASVAKDGSAMKLLRVDIRNRIVSRGLSEVSERTFRIDQKLPLADGTIAEDFITVDLDKDTGNFLSTMSSDNRIKGFAFSVPYLNPMNMLETIQAGRKTYTERVLPQPKLPFAQPLPVDTVADEFNKTNGEKTDMVKWAVNEFSETLAAINDNNLEKFITENVTDSIMDPARIEQYKAFKRLGGYAAGVTVDFSIRGVGGERPFTWLEDSIKDTVIQLMTGAETYTNIDKTADTEWVLFGYANDVTRFINKEYTSQASKTEDSVASDTKYGFKKKYQGSFSDIFGQRVGLIGITDKRWITNPILKNQVYGWQRSNTPNVQPTAVYHGYDARVLKLRTHGQGSVDAVLYFVHDGWDILTMSGIKLDVVNSMVLGQNIAESASLRVLAEVTNAAPVTPAP
jgi:hypothetical protein